MKENFEKLLKFIEGDSVRFYLVVANILLAVFMIVFSNVGLLPFRNISDFSFFILLGLILAFYRPTWVFAFFVGLIAFENINLAPKVIGFSVRPYQLFAILAALGFLIQYLKNKKTLTFPEFKWVDLLPIFFVFGGLLSALVSADKSISLKNTLISFLFVFIYFVVRIFINTLEDLKKMSPFFLSSAVVVIVYSFWQNISFSRGVNSFEIMPGRPNATFTEPDWLGIFLVFLLSVVLTLIYKKRRDFIFWIYWAFLVFIFSSIVITVSRSAWLGVVAGVLLFLKLTLVDGKWKPSLWQWKNFLYSFFYIASAGLISLGIVYFFHLTNFQLFNRAQSTASGLQKITIACSSESEANQVPQRINNISELEKYNCRHINLEDIEKEKGRGNVITEVYRSDPNVNIRTQIYQKSWEQIKQHPIMGIGWGNIGKILGTDERGAGLNASNIFLEVWLGTGIIGLISFVGLLVYVLVCATIWFMRKNDISCVFILLGWFAITVPNLFNSGIFLGFVWMYLAVAVSLMQKNVPHQIPD